VKTVFGVVSFADAQNDILANPIWILYQFLDSLNITIAFLYNRYAEPFEPGC
jgi:hypothetical protein